MSHKRLLLVILFIAAGVALFSRCVQRQESATADPRGDAFVDSRVCISCHRDISASYLHTAHALTSAPADSAAIKGVFTAGANEYSYGLHGKVVMQRRDSGFFQVAVRADGAGELHRFDIVIGSGRKAQTYLYWKGDGAYELPVSYFVTERAWAGSPHFPADSIWFGRAITTDCFECHASFVRTKPALHTDAFHQVDQFDRSGLLYGIDCQRCHGPGAQHVSWQTGHPEDRKARYMMQMAMLSRQQRLDLCAVCHSGVHTEQRSVFQFRPGQSLESYYYAEPLRNPDLSTMDVHGNQYQLLTASRCFRESKDMVCTTCHDPHRRERDDPSVFVQRCLNCHRPLPPHPSMDSMVMVTRCIDCHMPARASRVITMQTAAAHDPVADLVRTHRIAIYQKSSR